MIYNANTTLLLADHNESDRRALREYLEQEGYQVVESDSGVGVLSEVRRQVPHLIVLDVTLPSSSMSAPELCQRIKHYGDVPVVVVTALDDEETKLRALELYAEDYILKPLRCAEIAVRIKRILKRTWLSFYPHCVTAEIDERLNIDFLRRLATTPERSVRLTPLECRLLRLLIQNSGQILPNEMLLERLWGSACGSTNNLWEYVRRLRRKIGDDATKPRYIQNEPGLGYRFARPMPDSLGRNAEP